MKEKSRRNYSDEHICVDPFGSYTGKTVDRNEKPVQDADDL